MADKNLRIKVSTQGAKKAGKELGGVDNRLKDLAKSAGKAALAFFGARMLLSGMQEAIRLAGIQEQAEKKLSIALGGNTSALLKQASALQQVTTAGDEAIIEQQAFLASLKFTEEQIKEIIPVALDLSAATGISLESAVRNTAKTFSGLSGELGELIPQLRDLTAEEMKAGEAVKVMADLFGGQASKQARTMAGSIEQMKNAVSDAGEAVGDLFSPLIISAAGALKGAAEFADDFLTGLKNLQEFGDTGGLEAVVKTTDRTVIGYQNVNKAIANFTKQAKEMGMDVKQLHKDALFDDEDRMRSTRERLVFIKEAIDEELNTRKEKQAAHDQAMKEMRTQVQSEEAEMLEDLFMWEVEKHFEKQQLKEAEIALENKKNKDKQKALTDELRQASLVQGSAEDAMKAVVRAESMEAVSGLIASILKTVPFPANLILAAGAGATASKLIDKGLSSFAQGGDFVTSGPQMMMVGDNPGGRERVQVTPLSSPNVNGPQQGVTVNISGGVVQDDYVRNELIPALNKATGTGASLNA